MPAPVRQESGDSSSPLPATRSIEPVMGSSTLLRCASVTTTRSGSTGGTGSIEKSFTVPLASTMRMVSDFFCVVVVAV